MFSEAFLAPVHLIFSLDTDLLAIVSLSLQVSLLAVVLATLIGLPLGACVAVFQALGLGIILLALWCSVSTRLL